TPLDAQGKIDLKAFEQLIDFLLAGGIDGICVGGATSEYPHFELEERKALIACAAQKTRGRATLLSAIGASSLSRVLALGEHAAQEGSQAVLLPMPYFYRYEQEDLESFCREICRSLPLPCLLYNLPDFTNPLDLETSIRLLREEPALIGIKDSSGNREALTRFVQARNEDDFSLLVGYDSSIFLALASGWDGFVSGVANLCPELLVKEYRSFRAGDRAAAQDCQQLLDTIIAEVDKLPVPWGIRVGLEVRGISTGPLSLPLSSARRQQVEAFRDWFARWRVRNAD
ncbi:dihydrodipicolinate synthase family protein, partial [Acidobacteria bacterium AH-259-L09]|nr:dihydrodipicolinate synthase family protein [Acidobacteria bacterium AH-259-L09]